jgi:DNA-binding beta-propeller fold protein YncE
MHYKIAQLSLSPATKTAIASDIYIAQPDSIKEELAGKLFALIEIAQNNSTSIKIINFLFDTLEHNYYQNEKILLRERVSSLKVEHIFEAALAKSNKLFSEFLNSEKINLTNDLINICVGVIHENNLHFANFGKNKVLLIYPAGVDKVQNTINQGKPGYKTIDIAKQSNSEKNNTDKVSKIFSNVVSGPIPANGIVIITNEALPEYISNKKLTEITSTLPPISAVEQVKNQLAAINSYVSFSAIVIKNTTNDLNFEQTIHTKKTTEESIGDLNRTEESTEHLLTPSGIINFTKWAGLAANLFRINKRVVKTNYENQLNLKDKIFVKKKESNTLNYISSLLKNIVFFSYKAVSHGLSLIIQKNKLANIKNIFHFSPKKYIDLFFSKLFSLSKKSKLLLVLGMFLLIFFFYNLSVMETNIQTEEKQKNYQEIATLIEQKQNQAEANLLYSNDEGAKKLFDEIKSLIDTLPQENEEQKKKHDEFNSKFNSQIETIRRLTRLDGQEIADFSNINKEADPENITFSPKNNKIYSADSKQKSIYVLETKDNLITTIANLNLPISELKNPIKNNDDSVYYINGNQIIELTLKDEQLKNVPLDPGIANITSAENYNNKLYIINSQNNTIVRYNKTTANFNSPYAWLGSNIDISNAIDLSIDGHVYVLFSNGMAVKLLKGETTDFKLETIDPPLANPSKIIVSPEQKYLYILEPSQKRLVIYDKTGQFIIQYTSNSFNNPKDFQVNETGNEIFVLDGTKILKIKPNHLEK